MNNPFKKKPKTPPTETLQEIQQEFNMTMYQIGNLNYRRTMLDRELVKIGKEVEELTKKADKLGLDASSARGRIQKEMQDTVKSAEQPPATEEQTSA